VSLSHLFIEVQVAILCLVGQTGTPKEIFSLFMGELSLSSSRRELPSSWQVPLS
jgi:hypothetical protein